MDVLDALWAQATQHVKALAIDVSAIVALRPLLSDLPATAAFDSKSVILEVDARGQRRKIALGDNMLRDRPVDPFAAVPFSVAFTRLLAFPEEAVHASDEVGGGLRASLALLAVWRAEAGAPKAVVGNDLGASFFIGLAILIIGLILAGVGHALAASPDPTVRTIGEWLRLIGILATAAGGLVAGGSALDARLRSTFGPRA